jgi:ABC-type bacteriocin/lantibiotic exporter with double-glycine peptidase domain
MPPRLQELQTMPNGWLNVPHYKQEFHYSCVAACARMVLAHFGCQQTEEALRQLLSTQPSGTRARNVASLAILGFDVSLQASNVSQLRDAISTNTPVIVFLETGALDYWTLDVFHVVVLVGIDSTTVYLNDPFFDTAPHSLSLAKFEKAWAKTRQFAAFVRPQA